MMAPFSQTESYIPMANALRVLAMEAVERASSGHPGMPMGMADVATVLFRDFLKFNPQDPHWFDRDRFVLSAGHGSMLLYGLLYLTGYPQMTLDQLKNFRQLGSLTPGHPEYGHTPGVETTTGPLGQGFANGVGMAMAAAKLKQEFGSEWVNHKTYVMIGDGCLMEGISQEALSLAGHLKLSDLIVLFDDNQVTIDGPTHLSTSDVTAARFRASGWHVLTINGHDHAQIYGALAEAHQSNRPTLICCETTIGYGAPHKAGLSAAHGSPLGAEEVALARAAMGWKGDGFEIPSDLLKEWRGVSERNQKSYAVWRDAFASAPHAFKDRLNDQPFPQAATKALFEQWGANPKSVATRQSSGEILAALHPHLPSLMGGSADLTPSNNTLVAGMVPFSADHPEGQYVHYGIREHAMAAAMNGMALHGGIVPYGGTFLAFSDYCRPAIRLAALMGIRVIFVMTHDSIGLGEDGPTHQSVEHLAALRAIPGLRVFRPADGVETLAAWQEALETPGPSLLALSRQALPSLGAPDQARVKQARQGGYVVNEGSSPQPQVTLMSTGSEVHVAQKAQALLEAKGIATAVVSLPCWAAFDRLPRTQRDEILKPGSLRVAIEAAVGFGWEKYLGESGIFVGMHGFGTSAPAPDAYAHFGITAEKVVEQVLERLAHA